MYLLFKNKKYITLLFKKVISNLICLNSFKYLKNYNVICFYYALRSPTKYSCLCEAMPMQCNLTASWEGNLSAIDYSN